jgi:hypothetical protein
MITATHRLGTSIFSEQSHIRHGVRYIVFQLKDALKRILLQYENNTFISIQIIVTKHINYDYNNIIRQEPNFLHYIIRPVLFNMFHLLKLIIMDVY